MRYYVETDGRIFLVPRGEALDLPNPGELPFDVERIAPLPAEEEIWFCVPRLSQHPHEWPSKDDVSDMANVTPRVRTAVHATMPRVVVEGIHFRDGRVLLVRGSRGLTENRWTLPGGFLRFGESPEHGVLRELREEIGVDARIEELITIQSKLGLHTQLHWIMLFYRVAFEGLPSPDPDEISEARFVSPAEAAQLLQDPIMSKVILDASGVAG